MASNRAVTYVGPGEIRVHDIPYAKLELVDGSGVHPASVGPKCERGVILEVAVTNICGSDRHMVRGRTTARQGLVLGHEITGEIIEVGRDVEFLTVGDRYSVECRKPLGVGQIHGCGECLRRPR